MDGYIKWMRDRVGSQKILLVFATTCVVDDDGRLLWQQRGDNGRWGLPGGVLEVDEDLATCAAREAKEETGLDVEVGRLIGVYSSPDYDVVYPNGDEVQQVTFTFAATVAGGALRADADETLDLRWLPAGEIPATSSWYRQMAADLFAGGTEPNFAAGRPGERHHTEPYFRTIRRHIGHEVFIAPSALGAVFDDDGRLLLVRRSDDGTWSLPGGMVELGERVDQAMVNELREETGLEVEAERLVGVYSSAAYRFTFPNGDEVKSASCMFRCRVVGGELAADMDEVTEARFFAADEVPDLPPRFGNRVAHAFADAPGTIIG